MRGAKPIPYMCLKCGKKDMTRTQYLAHERECEEEACDFMGCVLPVGHKPEPHTGPELVAQAEAVYEALNHYYDFRHADPDEREGYLSIIRMGLRRYEDQQSSA